MATKKQKTRISQLGAEWTVLDSEEYMINKLICEHHSAKQLGVKQARELKRLLRHQEKLSKRKKTVSDEIIAIESGNQYTKQSPKGRRADPYVEIRDRLIRNQKDNTNKSICLALDERLARGDNAPPFGFPDNWTTKYQVKSFKQAYRHPKCRGLVDTLISKARKAY